MSVGLSAVLTFAPFFTSHSSVASKTASTFAPLKSFLYSKATSGIPHGTGDAAKIGFGARRRRKPLAGGHVAAADEGARRRRRRARALHRRCAPCVRRARPGGDGERESGHPPRRRGVRGP